MHLDRVGDRAQGQGLEISDAIAEEILLLADDLARHLDDRLLPLVERLHQPVGAGEAVGQPGLARLVLRAAGQFDIIGAVDQHARQRGAVDLYTPAFAGAADEQVGRDRRGAVAGEAQAGLGIIAAQFADHVGQILLIHAADAAQLGQGALGQQVEIGEQPLDAGIIAVRLLRLKGEAFGERAGTHAGGIEAVDNFEHGLDREERHAQAMGGLEQIGLQIARFADLADQLGGDQQVHARQRAAGLIHQMFLQAGRGIGETVEIDRFARTAAAAEHVERA